MTNGRRARSGATAFGLLVTVTDALPPRLRYGYVHRLTAALLRTPLTTLAAGGSFSSTRPAIGVTAVDVDLTCALASDSLDIGGIGAVIETLARGLSGEGIRPIVLCPGPGERAERLRADGIDVRYAASAGEVADALRDVDVLALHSAPEYLERVALNSGLPLVTVMHNTEIHFTPRRWAGFDALMTRSTVGVAVSETVREFHSRHVSDEVARRMRVVPNGVTATIPPGQDERDTARSALEATLGTALHDDVVFACLARYDSQKNVAGTVASFLHAVGSGLTGVRLVYAGEPSDWAELRRADAIRRSSPHRDRVHLLGNSDARTLLLAADAFLLNSFFEGWAVAATEAAALGVPMVLSDVGGAAELVALDAQRSVLVPNAVGEPAAVTDARVVAARRRSRNQTNRAALADALVVVAGRVRGDRTRTVPPEIRAGAAEMLRGHADALRHARTAGPVTDVA